MHFYWIVLRHAAPRLLSGGFFTEYDRGIVIAGGAFDQFGLTKPVICIFITEMLTVLGWFLFTMLSQSFAKPIHCLSVYGKPALTAPQTTSAYSNHRHDGPHPTPDQRSGVQRSYSFQMYSLLICACEPSTCLRTSGTAPAHGSNA